MSSDFVSIVSKPRITALAAALSIALMGAGSATSATRTPPMFRGFELGHAVAPHPRFNKHTLSQRPSLDLHRARDAIKHIVSTLPAARSAGHAPGVLQVTSRADSGSGSLRSALENAVDGDVIDLSNLRGTISLTSALQPNAGVEIRGPGRDLLTLDAGGLDRVITSAHSLRISNITIANGNATTTRPVGGCLLVESDLTLSNALVQGCALDGAAYGYAYGGAIAVLGTATIDSSTISDNTVTAPYYAGGGALAIIAQSAGSSSISNSTISGNKVTAGSSTLGGGIAAGYRSYGLAAALSVSNSIITGNSLNATSVAPYYYAPYGYTYYGTGDGGGLWAQGTNLTMTGSTVSTNTVTTNSVARGAGVFLQHEQYYDSTSPTYYVPIGGQATISNSIISSNTALSTGSATSGGGVYADAGLTLDHSTVSGNIAQTDTIQGAYAGGGGVYTGKYAEVSVVSSTISDNAATATVGGSANGGGFCNSFQLNYALNASLVNSTVSGNSATAPDPTKSFGGGFYQSYQAYPIALTVENTTIAFNTTGRVGGGVSAAYGATTTFNSVILSNNTADTAGTEDVSSPSTLTIGGDYNLFKVDPTTGNPSITITGTHNIVGQDAVLLPLADNGGPTQTHALDPASPAIDTGSNPLNLANDQRGPGFVRTYGAGTDIGAFEFVVDEIFANGFED